MLPPTLKVEPSPRRPEPLLRRDAVVTTLGISPRTFERLLAAGILPGPDLRIGRLTLWRPSTVAAWIEAESNRRKREAA